MTISHKKFILSIFIFGTLFFLGDSAFAVATSNIEMSPVSDSFSLAEGDSFIHTLTISNRGESGFSYKLYATPYFISDDGSVDFLTENKFTELSKWIQFKGDDGFYVAELTKYIAAGESQEISYQVTIPDEITDNSEYAVIFAEVINEGVLLESGVVADTRVGLTIFGHIQGTEIESSEITNLDVRSFITSGDLVGTSTIKNTGNTETASFYSIEISNLFGQTIYSDSSSEIIFPETEKTAISKWADTPLFGIFKVHYSASSGDNFLDVDRVVIKMPVFIIVIAFIIFILGITVIVAIIKRNKKQRQTVA